MGGVGYIWPVLTGVPWSTASELIPAGRPSAPQTGVMEGTMLTKEDNELLTLTGPGTPGGDFMRRYWQPIALHDELAENGSTQPIRLLGEQLVLYRGLQGQLGLLGRWCSHRATDLAQGWVEEEGLRCPLHGWLYDAQGRCLEQPMEPPESTFHESIQHPAYRCTERGGVIFAYLGPGEPPILPDYECLTLADESRASAKYLLECNYLQALEGNLDPAQVALLARLVGSSDNAATPSLDVELAVEPEDTEYGVRLAVLEHAAGSGAIRIVRNFAMPNLCFAPALGMEGGVAHWHVPIDDTHHWHYVLAYRGDGPISEEDARRNGVERLEGFRPPTTREAMATSYVAYATILAESQGPIYDRTQEFLGETDKGVEALRRTIYGGIVDVREGADPLHVLRGAEAFDSRRLKPSERSVDDGEAQRPS